MTTMEAPYFMQNRKWYSIPEDEGITDDFFSDGRGYHINDDAPNEAKDSYEEFFSALEESFVAPPTSVDATKAL